MDTLFIDNGKHQLLIVYNQKPLKRQFWNGKNLKLVENMILIMYIVQ